MGIFAPDGRPGLNLDPEAWRSNYAVKMKAPPGESPFPAQLRWRTLMRCRPLKEHLWAHIPSKSSLQLAGSVGDAILFDTRTVHRGMANSGTAKRPILYIAYARPWYTEGTKNSPDETLLS